MPQKSSGDSPSGSSASIPPSLTKQCLTLHHPTQKYTNESIALSSELIKLLIVEARRRAAIEAECEVDVDDTTSNKAGNDESDSSMMGDDDNSEGDNGQQKKKTVEIRGEHIARIAAELLMDLS